MVATAELSMKANERVENATTVDVDDRRVRTKSSRDDGRVLLLCIASDI